MELRELNFKLYLNPYLKKQYIRTLEILFETHEKTFKFVYEHLFTNTEEIEQKIAEEAESKLSNTFYSDEVDYENILEQIRDYVFNRLDEQFLMHYQFELMSISNLYQVFEQQLRRWLYEEMTQHFNEYLNRVSFVHYNKNNESIYNSFCNNFGRLTNLLSDLELTFMNSDGVEEFIVESDIWKTIKECNLISNTYKHGSGYSASNLYKIYPDYFEKVNNIKLMDLYRTTNLERVLNIEKISFESYHNAMKQFWEKMKEHQNGTVRMEIK